MGASLFYEPTKRKKYQCGDAAPQSFMAVLERVFGSRTPTLSLRDLPKLEALRDAEDFGSRKDAFTNLCHAVEKFEEIVISAEY